MTFAARASQIAWLIGAGTSAAAGIPTGQDMITDFKTRMYCAQVGIARREVDPGDPLWLERISTYFDGSHGFPQLGAPEEYAAAFELAYPELGDRRTYIDKAVRRGSPSFGHRVLAAVITSRQVPALFTTNFDQLIENSATSADELLATSERVHLAVADLNRSDVAERCVRESAWPLLVKLHGDFQSDRLKNIASELAEQDEHLRRAFVSTCQRFGLLVVGYSGRDASVMEALAEAAGHQGAYPAGLFWCVRPGQALLPAVTNLLTQADATGISVRIVEAANFDELAGALERQLDLPDALADHIRIAQPAARVQPVTLPTHEGARFPVLRTSAMPLLSMPMVARRIVLRSPASTPELREKLKVAGIRHTVVDGRAREVAAFGLDQDLLTGLSPLGPRLDGEVALDPSSESWALGLLYDALARALARGRPLRPMLRRHGHTLVLAPPSPDRTDDVAKTYRQSLESLRSAYGGNVTGTVPSLGRQYAESAALRLELWLDQWWCIIDPFTWIDWYPDGEEGPQRVAGPDRQQIATAADWRRERWARRYNAQWNEILAAWARLLAPQRETTIRATGVAAAGGVEATFVMSQVTGWCPPGRSSPVGGTVANGNS